MRAEAPSRCESIPRAGHKASDFQSPKETSAECLGCPRTWPLGLRNTGGSGSVSRVFFERLRPQSRHLDHMGVSFFGEVPLLGLVEGEAQRATILGGPLF